MPATNELLQQLTTYGIPAFPSVTGVAHAITARSLLSFFYALGWAWVLLISFTGWGKFLGRLFRVQKLPASVACTAGIAAVVFLGGLLNLFHAIYASAIFAMVALGVVLYLVLRRQTPEAYRWIPFWNRASRWSRLLIVIALLILFLRVAGTVRLGSFNANDDGSAYLVFPQKMLVHHHFAYDPFSDRRVISSLGGAYLLQAFAIAPTSLSHVAIADRTLGLALLFIALFDLGIAFELSAFHIALMEFLAYLVPQETINLTFVILPISLLIGMLWLLRKVVDEKNPAKFRNAILVGALGGAVISLKSTYLPIVGAYALIPYLWLSWRTERMKSIRLPLVTALGSIVVLAAWMIAMKASSGTYLFPVLGPGVDYSAYGLFHSVPRFTTHRAMVKVVLQGLILVLLICIQSICGDKNDKSRFGIGILAATALAVTAFNYKSGGDFIWRYNFPQFFVAVVVFYATTRFASRIQAKSATARLASAAGIVSLIAMMFYYDASGKRPVPFRQIVQESKDYRQSLLAGLRGTSLANATIKGEYRAAEAAIPNRGAALENVAYPFLFHDRAKTIYTMDWPGAAGPKPGWPFGKSAGRLAEYLKKKSVRYLLYDDGYISWSDADDCKAIESPERYSTELSVLFWMAIVANHQLDGLRSRYKSIYDDGKLAVVDLYSPLPHSPTGETIWKLESNKNQICAQVTERYFARHPQEIQSAKAGNLR